MGGLQIRFEQNQPHTITVHNSSGRKIFESGKNTSARYLIPMEQLGESGVYMIRVQTENKKHVKPVTVMW